VTAATVAVDVLLAAGTLLTVIFSVGALVAPDFFSRQHYVTPITSLAAPLVGLALAVANGWSLLTAQILITVFGLAATGPFIEAATARAAAQRAGLVESEPAE
jgi:multisubunit Na+/H+ antiporter MnhG subunit